MPDLIRRWPSIIINIAKKSQLDRIIRRKRRRWERHEIDVGELLKSILNWANEFVPSESGSIFLDDPVLKFNNSNKGRLYFIACFGRGAKAIVGNSIPSNVGIVGKVYTSGKPYISEDVKRDNFFYSGIDKKTKFQSKSIVCAPIEIEEARIGVIELINSTEKINYDRKDLTLLKIFAGYTSTLIQNVLDAKMFEHLSRIDNLTGLYNDRFFFASIESEIAKALAADRDLSLIFFDLDHFKEVNDTYGHLAGSRVLKEVGGVVEEIFGKTKAVLSRYGGDEFVIILPNTDLRSAGEYGEMIRKKIGSNIFLKEAAGPREKALNIKGVITCSLGIASLKENIISNKKLSEIATALIDRADKAMYEAKESGKNKACFAKGKV
ncbi:MAG: GGDEF domain-containing protein [Deltaproteobacteria bacterium]|nr:GGDEF domain-containing protein [Deltaproteobacteria bacterium]MBI3755748.1 GGDEF domain-containing protein [Deltaproteobacteria bacterium]